MSWSIWICYGYSKEKLVNNQAMDGKLGIVWCCELAFLEFLFVEHYIWMLEHLLLVGINKYNQISTSFHSGITKSSESSLSVDNAMQY